MEPTIPWDTVFLVLGIVILTGLCLAMLLAAWVVWRVKRINVPADAGFLETLRATPLSVVILLDLLDLSLDIFSAPFAWVILGRLGLEQLRTVTLVEAIIPGTQAIPTMTIAWIIARVWKNGPRQPNMWRYPGS